MNIPVFFYNERRAHAAALAAFQAMRQREEAQPVLTENPFWRTLKRLAYAEFEAEFTKTGPHQ